MKLSVNRVSTVFFLFGLYSCTKPYAPNIVSTDLGYLVVDGFINSGSDSTVIKLSRTVKLTSTASRPETGATVVVESDQNTQYALTETAPGTYVAQNLNLSAGGKYRLHIYTASKKEYVSDFVENKITPPIDSISYKILSKGVQFYVSTHDPANSTRYYRWDYSEEWGFFSPYFTAIEYKNGAVANRPPDSSINYCYKHPIPGDAFFVSSSDKLTRDEIYKFPLTYIASEAPTWKFQSQYCLTVKQYALTADAYKYWQLLKKNTEQLGSIFDAQPSTALTNLHCVTNPAEQVIGYVGVSTVTLKRIFFTDQDFPFPVIPPKRTDSSACPVNFLPLDPPSSFSDRLKQAVGSGDSLLTVVVIDPVSNLTTGYDYASAICVDCQLEGGTTVKPSYWPSW